MISHIEIYENKVRIFYDTGSEMLVIEESFGDFFSKLASAFYSKGQNASESKEVV